MTQTDTSSAADYIASLPALPPPLKLTAVAAQDPPSNTPSASVAGNSLVAFTANLDGTHKTELLYVMGWAQLQAQQNYGKDPQTDPVGYYQAVTSILTNVGFVAEDISFANYQTKTATVELDKVVLDILGGLLTGPELSLVDAALAALDAAASDNGAPWTIYSSSSSNNNAGSFAVGLADESTAPDGTTNVSMSLSAFSFSGTENNERFLWISHSSTSLTIKDGATTVVLNDDLWNTPGIGSAITAQMKANSAGYIANLPPLKPH
jgi:hypothetical protein